MPNIANALKTKLRQRVCLAFTTKQAGVAMRRPIRLRILRMNLKSFQFDSIIRANFMATKAVLALLFIR